MDKLIPYITQIIALIILFYVSIFELKLKKSINTDVQLIIAIIIMFIFIVIDPYAGFILACAIFIIYYKSLINKNNKNVHWDKYNTYITPQNLDNIQSNIFDKKNLQNETIGFNDGFIISQNPVYGIQGMNKIMPAYDNDNISFI